jgi:hypothetical protein
LSRYDQLLKEAGHNGANLDADEPPDLRCPCGSGWIQGSCPACGGGGLHQAFNEADEAEKLPIITFGQLLKDHPKQRDVLIDKLLRVGEVMNIIASPKVGKSWLSIGLAFAIATGTPWYDLFHCSQGEVLLIDNELHPETIAYRLRKVADAAHISHADLESTVSVLSLRGQLRDLRGLGLTMDRLGKDRFKLIILDAFYRAMPLDMDENSNATMAQLYNLIDGYTQTTGASFALIHHASKGDQSGKVITDVGSGAGAQSRATDTHLILRPHEEDNAIVLDAVVRSFPPLTPYCLKWAFPLWTHAPDLDPLLLRQPKPRPRRKPEGGDVPAKEKEAPWTAKRFADAFGSETPKLRDVILEEARVMRLSERNALALLKSAVGCGYLHEMGKDNPNKPTLYSTKPYEPPPKKKKCRARARAHPPTPPQGA